MMHQLSFRASGLRPRSGVTTVDVAALNANGATP